MAKTIAPPQSKRAISSRPRRACTVTSAQSEQPSTSKIALKTQKRKTKPKVSSAIRKVKPKKTKKIGGTLAKGVIEKLPITQRRQSPIDIRSDVISHDPDYCKVDSLNISYTLGDCHDVICDNRGFRVNIGRKCTSTFSASHLPGTFELAQFHAHWSKDGSCGSEHLLDGKAMSGEVHFVYWNTKYGSFCEAVEKDDGLAVIGVFIKEGSHSDNYQPLFEVIRKAHANDQPVPMPKDFVLDQLLPPADERDFVTYLGSLTTPPFSESVIWTVLTHPIEVSTEQLNILRKIVAANFRECQDLCERVVRTSRGIKA